MQLHPRVDAIVQALYTQFRDLAEGTDAERRRLTKKIVEQVVYELGDSWGWKSSSPSNPPSKDAIAQRQIDGGLFAWDLFHGESRKPIIGGLWHDIRTQHFIEVAPVNHLIVSPVPEPIPEDDFDEDIDEVIIPVLVTLDQIQQKLDALSSHINVVAHQTQAIQQKVLHEGFKFSFFGKLITIR